MTAPPDPQSRQAAAPPGRETNTVEPGRRRAKAQAHREPAAPAASGPSLAPGDLPAVLARRYLAEPQGGGGAIVYYEGPGAKHAAFRDYGHSLATDQTHPAIARDLAAIAAHRGWSTLRVRGEDDFRREIWFEARLRGLEVQGYRPRERDELELQRRQQAERSKTGRPPLAPPGPDTAARPAAALDLDLGVSGVLLETGVAPYRRRAGAQPTPFLRLDRGEGPALEIWGAGLPDALARAAVRPGESIYVRRDGLDRADGATAPRDRSAAVHPRAGWIIAAERFRTATPAQAARQEALAGAQSHLAVLDVVIKRLVRDPDRRRALYAEARDLVAEALARGKRFDPARVGELEPPLAYALKADRGAERRRAR